MPIPAAPCTPAFHLDRRRVAAPALLVAALALLVAGFPPPAFASPCGDATPVAAIGHHSAGPLSPGAVQRFRVEVPTTGILALAVETPIGQTPIGQTLARLTLLDCESGEATTIESFEQARTVAVRQPGKIGFEVTADAAVSGYLIRTAFVPAGAVGSRVDLRILDPVGALFASPTGEPQSIALELRPPSHGHGEAPIELAPSGSDHEDASDDLEIDVLLTPSSSGMARVLLLRVGRPGVLRIATRSTSAGGGSSTSAPPEPSWLAAARAGDYLLTIEDAAVAALHLELLDLCGPGQLDPDATAACATTLAPGSTSLHELENAWPADVDTFSFLVTAERTVTLATLDGLDTLGALDDRAGHRLAFDSGDGAGFLLRQTLEPGVYFLRVEGRIGTTGLYRPVLSIAAGK